MFEKYDPGFLGAFIGLLMTFGLRYFFRWIKILYRFSKLLTKLDELVKSNKNSSKVIELVEEARNVPWFKFIRRYQIGKSMDELISEIKAYDLKEIVIDLKQPGGANKEIDQAVAEPGAAEERAVEEQTVGAQLDTPEEIIIGENPMIAGLRRRVRIRPEISENDHARHALTTAAETENKYNIHGDLIRKKICNDHARLALTTAAETENKYNIHGDLIRKKIIMAELEWYKEICEKDGGIGYYDTFKDYGDSRAIHVDRIRLELAEFWDKIIEMWEGHELPSDFESQKKWIKSGNKYRRFIEPLDIARYYAINSNGNYLSDGRPKRHKVLQKLMEESENLPKRSHTKCASLTSDSCFWAHVEEALKDLENLKRGQQESLHSLEIYEKYVTEMKNALNLSSDVFLEGSSFMRWSEEWEEYKKIQSRG